MRGCSGKNECVCHPGADSALLILIGVIFTGCLVWPMGLYGAPEAVYSAGPVVKGFLEGYQTMDTIAALNFGML